MSYAKNHIYDFMLMIIYRLFHNLENTLTIYMEAFN